MEEEQTSKSGQILVVDDYEPARFVRRRILEGAGYYITESCTATEAYQASLDEPLAVALLDVELPDENGWTLCQRIKEARPALPVLMISAVHLTHEARRAALDSGATMFLVDPVSPARLLDAVARATGRPTPHTVARAHVWTDLDGYIRSVDDTAVVVLNTASSAAQGRSLLTFFDEDRVNVYRQLRRAAG